MPVTFWAEYAWLPTGAASGVGFSIVDGRFASVEPGTAAGGATVLSGLTLPGLANVHSHAFHRALRGRTQAGPGSFWTWRERMYDLAGRLDPASCRDLARATDAEMVLAGITGVGEFHYLHHGPDGRADADPNEIGRARLTAAAEAGLLDTLYLTSTVDGAPPEGPQRRFSDGTVGAWAAARVSAPEPDSDALIAAAANSVRAVPGEALAEVAAVLGRDPSTTEMDKKGTLLHAQVSEQPGASHASIQAAWR